MSEATKTTPRPWKFEEAAWLDSLFDSNGETVFVWDHRDWPEEETEDNRKRARKMVLAMNMHDELVAVIRDVIGEHLGHHSDGRRFCNLCKSTDSHVEGCWVGKLESALADAEVKTETAAEVGA